MKNKTRPGVWSSELSGFSSGGDYAYGHIPFDKAGNQHRSSVALAQQAHDNTLAQMAQSQEYNKENMALQNQYAIDAENRANEYNSPAAQIARADAAGISPLAALGMAGNVQTVSSAPSSSTPGAPGASPGRPSDGGSSLGQLFSTITGVASGFASVSETMARVGKIAEETKGLQFDNVWKAIEAELAPQIKSNKILGLELEGLQGELRKAWFAGGEDSQAWNEWKEGVRRLKTASDLDLENVSDIQETRESRVGKLLSEANLNNSKSLLNNLTYEDLKANQSLRQAVEKMEYRKMGQSLQYFLKHLPSDKRLSYLQSEIDSVINSASITESNSIIAQAQAATAIIREWVEIGAIGVEAASSLLSVFLPSKAVSDIIGNLTKKSPKPIGFLK